MINFPQFKKLEVNAFGLYPGTQDNPGLSIDFMPGLTLILGANGLGKTTLITILYRLLTGPYDIPALTARANLGSASLQPTALTSAARKIFARRVTDGAQNASARLTLAIGDTEIIVQRRLRDLALLELVIDSKPMRLDETKVFQSRIAKLVGVWSFGDWILLLRHMVFYFEDRRALVWDPSAQRQLLRLLLLPEPAARKWTEDERTILELDSRMRNLRFAVYREEQALTGIETKVRSSADVRQELQTLEQLQSTDIARREVLDQNFVTLDDTRQKARLRYFKAQQERESRYRKFERAKLLAVESRFPVKSDSARYILEHLFVEADCLVCGNHVPDAAALLQKRITDNDCVVCGAGLSESTVEVPATTIADRRAKSAAKALRAIEPELSGAFDQHQATAEEFDNATAQLAELDAKIAERTARIDVLISRLPPSEQEIHEQRSELASMRSRTAALTAELTEKRGAFGAFVGVQNHAMVGHSSSIMETFAAFAGGFLLETVNLVWAPQRARVGQTGETIQFPAFELDMTGTNFPTAVRRSGPEHVSESQREFIDLAFRMSLMQVASEHGVSSLVIDAPESSLDAVFVTRAADVLAKFGNSQGGNRLTITTNLAEGELVPELIKRSASPGDRISRVVDLFAIAEPTAAIRELGTEYREIMDRLLAKLEPNATEAGAADQSAEGSRPND